jgi:hypothetical protein
MGTKNDPGKFDCYQRALPDEPTFTLLARDPDFFRLVKKWAKRRMKAIQCGDRPQADYALVGEAEKCAWEGQRWRVENLGKWRKE